MGTMSPGPVVVGVDGSTASLAAVRWAAHDAELRGCPLHIVYAAPRRPARNLQGGGSWPDSEEVLARATVAAARMAPGTPVSCAAVPDLPGAALVAASGTAAVLVVGSRGSGGVPRMLLGSAGTYAAMHAECPVVVVPPRCDPAGSGPVVVGIDGSEVANLAARFAFEEAALRRAGLGSIRAVPPEGVSREAVRMQLATAVARWVPAFPDVRFTGRVVTGHPAGVLASAAADAQLLVVGSRGYGAVRRLALGSVSLRLLHTAGCPVAVVHPHHHNARPGNGSRPVMAGAVPGTEKP